MVRVSAAPTGDISQLCVIVAILASAVMVAANLDVFIFEVSDWRPLVTRHS